MAVDKLVEQIQKLPKKQIVELLHKLGYKAVPLKEKLRGGYDDPLTEIIGIGEGPKNGSTDYKDDLYGNNTL